MRKDSNDIVRELKKDALEYITYIKGKDLTKEDVNTAETLMIYGYLKAKLKPKKRRSPLSLAGNY
jgi:hypothetical protein